MRIGVDIVSVSRVAQSLSASPGFTPRVFSVGECERAEQMPERRAYEFLAGRFAVKEAVLKALHPELNDMIALCDIETTSTIDGCPELHLHASALRASQSLGVSHWQVSISYENGFAIAFVLAH